MITPNVSKLVEQELSYKIILEIKAIQYFTPQDFKQVLAYLKAKNIELGIIANFRTGRLEYKRILNSQYN